MWNDDDLTLLLLHDNNAPEAWVDAWTRGYPLVQRVGVSAMQSVNERLTVVQAAFATIASQNVVAVAHGMGANALLSWHYVESWTMHKRLRAAILLAPGKSSLHIKRVACALSMPHGGLCRLLGRWRLAFATSTVVASAVFCFV
ncbi:alpha/beta hydrolase [Kingella kingae]|uniref:alpha/beta hydrolase n=1 Tax=Kingella kingae TaxID=504 RepID=UPI000416461A|nr:alpha/beta hydrolase [Kingella kingae]